MEILGENSPEKLWSPREKSQASKESSATESGGGLLCIPPLMEKWLVARGILDPQSRENFFSPSLGELTHPFKLKGMEEAVERLIKARIGQEKICVYGDYDLDGSSGIALLTRGLKLLKFTNVTFYQPSRFLEGYGIHADALDFIAKDGAKIVISVDCGITAIEEAKHARSLGLDLIITDHHLARVSDCVENIPDALAVINPNHKLCQSGLGHLSGVGVGFYLLLGLKSILKEPCDLKTCLDYFAIGTITDMVPLRLENRVLVKHGLKVLSKTQRPGLQALLKKLDLWGRDLDSVDVAFSFAPKLNALSRLELHIRPLDIMMCEDPKKAEVLAEEVISLNEKRKSLQMELEERILSQLKEEESSPAIVLQAQGHAGVVGLIATKVSQLTGKPAFIVALHQGDAVGSARGAEAHNLPSGLSSAAQYLERFGGHAQAAGFSLKPENFKGLKDSLLKYYGSLVATGPKKITIYDVEAKLEDFSENFMNWLKQAGPFGADNPQPLFRIKGAKVSSLKWLKDLHLKLTLEEREIQMEAIAFFAKGQFDTQIGSKVDLLAEPSWNYFRGQRRVQLLIRDLITI